MVDEGDSSSQDLLNGNIETSLEMEVVVVNVPSEGAEEMTLQIKLKLPEGVSLNEAAPNKWKVEHHGESFDKLFSHYIYSFLFPFFDITLSSQIQA